jgi:transcriptional regulator with XRE-family HTH domain
VSARRPFAEKLNYLWDTVHPPGRPNTLDQVVGGVAAAGYEISASYLSQLRNGVKTNPTLNTIRGLAAFFGVPAAYFLDEAEEARINDQLSVIVAMRDAGVRNVALRTHGLSERDLAALHAMISSLREARGLPPDQPETGHDG